MLGTSHHGPSPPGTRVYWRRVSAALTAALKDFKGAVVTVSHNEAFVAEISNEKWVAENGSVTIVQLRDAKAR